MTMSSSYYPVHIMDATGLPTQGLSSLSTDIDLVHKVYPCLSGLAKEPSSQLRWPFFIANSI